MSRNTWFGLFNIHKPSGWSSRDVVNKVARIVRPAKAGHAGTLDPLASGVLIVCVGPATRLVNVIHESSKVYRTTFLLGQTSNTDDREGEIVPTSGASAPSIDDIRCALTEFVGEIDQVPPSFSAVHVNGQRAYKAARRGEEVRIPAKTVRIHRLELLSYNYPKLELEIECGTGTYIRSIARDLGRRLDCGALMRDLERTRVGSWTLDTALRIDEFNVENAGRLMLPAGSAVATMAQRRCTADEVMLVVKGRRVPAGGSEGLYQPDDRVALLNPKGELLSIAQFDQCTGELAPRQVFVTDGSTN